MCHFNPDPCEPTGAPRLGLPVLLLAASGFLFVPAPTAGEEEQAAAKDREPAARLFSLRVLPLLKSKCFACHGDESKGFKGELDIRSRTGLLRGGESEEPALVPGKPEESLIIQAVRWEDLEMPPKKNDRLTAAEIELIRRWIAAGAPWPDEKTQARHRRDVWKQPENADGFLVPTSGGLADEWTYRRYKAEDLWAFRPLKDVEPPTGEDQPIDAFIRRRLDRAGLRPAPRAARVTLIRRATYDLTGLPPTPEEIDAFLADDSPNAWEKLIDRLLSSPHHGEQWGRHWLDVVRYADTSGYSNDWERSNAWRYRDYVVRSINADKPYDRFVLEQIAGDELDPDDPEVLIAVGFLRMGPWEHTGMSQEKVSRQLWLDDVTNSVGQVFLSTPLRCARCHDHKFDPLPTRDYYRVQAVFAATQLAERPARFLESERLEGFDEGRARVRRLLEWARADVAEIKAREEKAARAWCKERGIPYIPRTWKNKDLPEDRKPPRHIGLDSTDQGFLKVREQDARIWSRRLERFEPLAQSVYNGGNLYQQSVRLRTPEKPQEKNRSRVFPGTHILAGGSVFSPLEEVKPGVLSAIPVSFARGSPAGGGRASELRGARILSTLNGRRLSLARWIASPDNPLATRSIANRIWQYHLGKGIAENSNNFGTTGKKPTHPELLDWLARAFVGGGWSMKALHRLIMTSATYQQSSRPRDADAVREKDPANSLLAHFRARRLTAEELRDSLLALSGELVRRTGGLPVRPEINLEVALQPRMLQSSLAPACQPSRTPAERNRRSIYVYRCRGQANPLLEVFNQPSPNDSCELRDASTVTPQVFTLLNSEAVTDRSIAMALRLEREAGTLPARVERAFQLALGRSPTDGEKSKLVAHGRSMVSYHREHPPEPRKPPVKVKRSVVEEMSGLAFDYVERLDVYEDYVPDAKPWDVSPEVRALADICLILFNTNEFIYVY
ncbi:MAG: PSD1 and planctomycete cytochrome C domain-containing protein [Planctomycetota bacterium]|nr:PSD1 and planctomycete cytochrome C domain-containing protein [Planctomycetota bacterium]